MRKIRQTSITTETRERLTIRRNGKSGGNFFCDSCGGVGSFAELSEATAFAGVSLREIFRFVEAGSIHILEDRNAEALVCLESLVAISNVDQPAQPACSQNPLMEKLK